MANTQTKKASESVLKKYNRFLQTIEGGTNTGLPKNLSGIGKLGLFLDFMGEYLFHGAYLQDYLQYDFYWKKRRERERYVVHGKLLEIMKTCNNPEHRHCIEQKPDFNRIFRDFLQRDYLDMTEATEDDFVRFLENKEDFFAKQPDGEFGTGVQKIYKKDIADISTAYQTYKEKRFLLEETLTQCKEMAEFNDSSVNTLRVVTIRKADGNAEVVSALLRVGRKGHIADNFHHMGIAAFLDTCGIVSAQGVDRNLDRYIVHPDSGKKIVGFEVPIWDQVKETVCNAAQLVPDMRYIGWDVVITKDYRVALVEGNCGADPDAEQISSRQGRWPIYRSYLQDIKALNAQQPRK